MCAHKLFNHLRVCCLESGLLLLAHEIHRHPHRKTRPFLSHIKPVRKLAGRISKPNSDPQN